MMTLTKQDCIEAVKQVVVEILGDFGLPTSGVGPSTIPREIAQFDSQIGISGTVQASGATNIEVPLDESLFVSKKGQFLTIEQAADRLMELQAKQSRKRSQNGQVGVA